MIHNRQISVLGVLFVVALTVSGCQRAIREGVADGISGGLAGAFESLILTPAEQAIADAFPESSD